MCQRLYGNECKSMAIFVKGELLSNGVFLPLPVEVDDASERVVANEQFDTSRSSAAFRYGTI